MTFENLLWLCGGVFIGAPLGMITTALCVASKRSEMMSDPYRTPEEYIQRYARDRNISIQEAREHAMVKEVIKEKTYKAAEGSSQEEI